MIMQLLATSTAQQVVESATQWRCMPNLTISARRFTGEVLLCNEKKSRVYYATILWNNTRPAYEARMACEKKKSVWRSSER